jgi:hypothetical protein
MMELTAVFIAGVLYLLYSCIICVAAIMAWHFILAKMQRGILDSKPPLKFNLNQIAIA